MRFWGELRRRNVVKVGVAYAAVAWLLIQVASIIVPTFKAPDWVAQSIMFVLVLGFPVTLLIAWAFEITPEGIRRTRGAALDESVHHITGQRLNYIVIGLLGLAVAFLVIDSYLLTDDTADPSNSIAVIPFINISSDPEQEYFVDGLSEELMNQLAQIDELLVTARTSSFAFKGTTENVESIGEQLGVDHVLEGSVRKAGNQILITAQLTETTDGFHLWSDTYDRELDDIFAIQEEIAKSVAEALSVTFGISTTSSGTDDIEVFDLYSRARSFGVDERAIALLQEVVALDPDFARARGDLAWVYYITRIIAPERRAEMVRALEELVDEALDRAPNHWSSHFASALLYTQRKQWIDADRAYALAADLAPASTIDMNSSWATFLLGVGRIEDAMAVLQDALRVDPWSLANSNILQQALTIAGRGEEAEAEYRRSRDIGVLESIEHTALIRIWSDGNTELIQSRFDRYLDNQVVAMTLPAQVRDVFDDANEALALVRAAVVDADNQDSTRMASIARYAAHFGDTELALTALHRGLVELGGSSLLWLWSPDFRDTRREPGFKDLVRELGLIDYWRETNNWSEFCRPINDENFECS